MEYFENIESYLLNRLSAEDKVIFEKEAQSNEDLARALEIQRFELETIHQMDEDDLRKQLKGLSKTSLDSPKTQSIPQKKSAISRSLIIKGFAIAASVLILIGLLFFPQNNLESIDLVASSYESAKLNFGESGVRATETNPVIFNATAVNILKTRNKNNAKEAIEYFKNYQSDTPSNNHLAQLNLGHSFLLNENNEEAIATFMNLIEDESVNKRLQDEADFFRALAFYQNQEKLKAKVLLQKIVDQKGRFSNLAKKILNEQI